MANGGAARASDEFARARAFQASRQQGLRLASFNPDVEPTPPTGRLRIADEDERAPLLELPKKSYTTAGEGPASRIAEMERQRAAQKKMAETAQAFLGAPAVAEQPAEQPAPVSEARPRRRVRAPSGEGEDAEAERAQELATEREAERARLERVKTTQSQLSASVRAASEYANERDIKIRFDMIKRGLAAGSISGWMLLFLLMFMNLQVINTFTFQNPLFPKATTKDIFLTALGDLLFLNLFLLAFSPIIFIGGIVILLF